jgi:Fe-S cluster assembly protein SufB
MVVQNSQTTIEHEASSSNMAAEQKFYLFQRGIDAESATCLIVNGFCEEIFSYLPSEFSTEADKLLNLKLVDSVG